MSLTDPPDGLRAVAEACDNRGTWPVLVGEKGERQLVIRCAFNDFGQLQSAIEARGLHPLSSESEYIAQNLIELPEDKAKEVLELVDALEQDEDVQRVFHTLG